MKAPIKIRAGALQFVLFIGAIIAILLFAFVLISYTHSFFGKKTDLMVDVIQGTEYGTFSPNSHLNRLIAGPAELIWTGSSSDYAILTIEVIPSSFPPDKTIILPEGTVGTVHVESSTNLIDWQDEWSEPVADAGNLAEFPDTGEPTMECSDYPPWP